MPRHRFRLPTWAYVALTAAAGVGVGGAVVVGAQGAADPAPVSVSETPAAPPVEVEDLDAAPVVATVAPLAQPAPVAPLLLDETPTTWSLTAAGAIPPLSSGNGGWDPATGRTAYLQLPGFFLYDPAAHVTTTIARPATGGSLIAGGPQLGAIYVVGDKVTTAREGSPGKWTAITSAITTAGPGTPSGCEDAAGDGHVAIISTTAAEKAAGDENGRLMLAAITGGVVGPFVDAGQGEDVTAPSIVCSATGADQIIWRQQVRAGSADIWGATLVQGALVGPGIIIKQGFDGHLAIVNGTRWVGYHAAGAYRTRGEGPGTLLAELGKFVEIEGADSVIATLYGEWPTREDLQQAASPTGGLTRRARLEVSLDGGATWTKTEPFGPGAVGYGPCNLLVVGGSVKGACKAPEGIAGFEYRVR